jgi:putative phosphoserine phosphatase/1-acylglycerol-3-phosphate O-acyltransferase
MSIGAFFDIDGTLLAPPSLERRFLRYLRWRGEFGVTNGARWLARFLRRSALDWNAAIGGNKKHLTGVRATSAEDFAGSLARRSIELFPAALERVAWHAAQAHKIFLVSGTLAPLAKMVARQLPWPAIVCATELKVRDAGRNRFWTGEIAGEPICGPGKARAMERLAAAHGIDLGRSYVYADAWSDRGMLERAGHPAAVNPSARLARLAKSQRWEILAWREREATHGKVIREFQRSRV